MRVRTCEAMSCSVFGTQSAAMQVVLASSASGKLGRNDMTNMIMPVCTNATAIARHSVGIVRGSVCRCVPADGALHYLLVCVLSGELYTKQHSTVPLQKEVRGTVRNPN